MRALVAVLLAVVATTSVAQAAPVEPSPATPSAAGVSRLAYMTAGGRGGPTSVWLARADGSAARRIAAGEAPVLSPDGRKLALARVVSRRRALLILSPRRRVLGEYFDFRQSVQPLAWSPDSRYLAVWALGPSAKRPRLVIVDTVARRMRVVARGEIEGVSFAPEGADRLVFGLGRRELYSAPRDLYVVRARGGRARRLTDDGNSLNPVWSRDGILYDHRRLRAPEPSQGPPPPAYEIFLYRQSGSVQVTHVDPPPDVVGLVPVAVSADGTHLLANYYEQQYGPLRSFPWAVEIPAGTAQPLTPLESGWVAEGRGISRDGSQVLVENEPAGLNRRLSFSSIGSIPFSGGPQQSLVHAAGLPSWSLAGNSGWSTGGW
jgi:dipeptidyl aminopeptidase/acylaminoacyl peptidase